jgi:formamidopyrimidine-DNA glycosylase
MLEIPESITIAKQLNETIKGKVIRHAIANQSEHKFAWYYGSPESYPNLLEDQVIGDSYARAGILEIQAGKMRIAFADGATLRYYDDYTKVPKKNQLYLEFEDDSALMVTIQMYGGIWAFSEGEFQNPYYLGACEKPSVFSKEFTYEYFRSLYTEALAKKSVKAFLATEQRIPGLGNGVLQDILYQAHLHPKRKMNTISEEGLQNLYSVILTVLGEMVAQGGRDTEKDLYGDNGKYITYLSKKTYLSPCPKCGYEIHKENFMGGTIYFCDHCQPLE